MSGLPALPNMRIGSKSYEQPLFYIKQDLTYMNIMVLVPKTLRCKQALLIAVLKHEAELNFAILIFRGADLSCWKQMHALSFQCLNSTSDTKAVFTHYSITWAAQILFSVK